MASQPYVPKGSHPIETHHYTVATKSIEETVNVIYQWVDIQLPGAIIYGDPRLGKTTAIRYIMANIPMIFGTPIPAYLILCKEQTQLSEMRFYEDMLSSMNYALANSGKTSVKRRRLIRFLSEAAREVSEYRVLMFIDDAQWLREIHYKWLMDIHNELKLEDIDLIVILVGQEELIERRNSFEASRQLQITGRFMTCTHHFHGIQDVNDIKKILRGYDIESEYPEGSGCTFTNYYVPVAYDEGWRLLNHANLIWQAFSEIRVESNMSKLKEIPMQPFTSLVGFLLKELSQEDNKGLKLSLDDIKEAINYVAYIQLEQHATRKALSA